ncbi:MAG: recombinase family protein, partial [Caldilineae bacterium]
MKAIGYIRVSTEEQAGRGHSLDAQSTLIREFVAARGWQLLRIYADEGLSGSRDDRPALQQLLRDARHQAFEVVIVHAIDRFYRSLAGLLAALDLLHRHNVSFV